MAANCIKDIIAASVIINRNEWRNSNDGGEEINAKEFIITLDFDYALIARTSS
jgi:hypothetical protein